MKSIYISIVITCCLTSCSKDALKTYGSTSNIYLGNESKKPVEYSFAFHPGVNKDTVPVVLKLIGKVSDRDREVSLTVDAPNTTAVSGDYQLPSPVIFRAGHATDTIALIIIKSDRLQSQKYKIRLVLNENEEFEPGLPANRYIDIIFSDMIAQPAWWNNIVTNNFLSQYSDEKYRLFIEATGISDMSGLSENEQRAYSIIFRDFLARGRESGAVYQDENGMINVSPNLM